jgi:hypothetical protein
MTDYILPLQALQYYEGHYNSGVVKLTLKSRQSVFNMAVTKQHHNEHYNQKEGAKNTNTARAEFSSKALFKNS